MTETEIIDESTFLGWWLLRHHTVEVRRILNRHGNDPSLPDAMRQLFEDVVSALLDANSSDLETAGQMIAFNANVSAFNSFLALVQTSLDCQTIGQSVLSRIDWEKVVRAIRNPPAHWESNRGPKISTAHRCAVVAVNPLTDERREFASVKDAAAHGFSASLIYRAINGNVKHKGYLWGWKPAKDFEDSSSTLSEATA